MNKKLENLLMEENLPKKRGFLSKFKKFYVKNIDSYRKYLASLGALSIGVANWSKDFAYNAKVVVPFLYTYLTVNEHEWYNLAIFQETFTIVGLTATAKYATLYQIGSVVNSVLYYTIVGTQPLGNYYGGIWNAIFYFYQIPIFFIMLKNYFGSNRRIFKQKAQS